MVESYDTISSLQQALADAIRRPMGVMPDSCRNFVDEDSLEEAEQRRQALTVPDLKDGISYKEDLGNGWHMEHHHNSSSGIGRTTLRKEVEVHTIEGPTAEESIRTVSYTHLTLPTNSRV